MVKKEKGRMALLSGTSGAILFSPAAGRGSRPLTALLSQEREEEKEHRVAAQGRDGKIWALHAE